MQNWVLDRQKQYELEQAKKKKSESDRHSNVSNSSSSARRVIKGEDSKNDNKVSSRIEASARLSQVSKSSRTSDKQKLNESNISNNENNEQNWKLKDSSCSDLSATLKHQQRTAKKDDKN